MTELEIRGSWYRLFAVPAGDRWVARAFARETNERVGVDAAGASEAAAVEQLRQWLEWHHDHAAALDALRQAERTYHRAVTDRAFERPESGAAQAGKKSLDRVDLARAALDAVRARRPVL